MCPGYCWYASVRWVRCRPCLLESIDDVRAVLSRGRQVDRQQPSDDADLRVPMMIVVVTNMLSDVEWHDDRLGQGGVWVWQSARLKLVRGLELLTTPPPRHHPAPPDLYVAATSKGPRCCRREARLTRGRGVVGGLARSKWLRLESGADPTPRRPEPHVVRHYLGCNYHVSWILLVCICPLGPVSTLSSFEHRRRSSRPRAVAGRSIANSRPTMPTCASPL